LEQLVLHALTIPIVLPKHPSVLGPDHENGVKGEAKAPVRDPLECLGEARRELLRGPRELVDDKPRRFAGEDGHAGLARRYAARLRQSWPRRIVQALSETGAELAWLPMSGPVLLLRLATADVADH